MTIFEKLKAPFPVMDVQWRVQRKSGNKAMVLAYIDARMVMDRLDEVVGPANWTDSYNQFGSTMTCALGLRIEDRWTTKEDGAGVTDVEAEKGQLSDAFKRAAVKWGIGRYLYEIKSPYVEIDSNGNITDASYEYLYTLLPNNEGGLTPHALQGQAKTPALFWQKDNYNILQKMPKVFCDAHGDANWQLPETVVWACEAMPKYIDKAPSRLALTKLQADNLLWMSNAIPPEDKAVLMEGFSIRARQFEQLKGSP